MKSLNRISLIGNLGKDPELRYTKKNIPVVSLSIATTVSIQDADGGWVAETQWHNVVCFDKLALFANQHLRKGQTAFIDGTLKYGSYTNAGGLQVKTTSIYADNVVAASAESRSPLDEHPATLMTEHDEWIKAYGD